MRRNYATVKIPAELSAKLDSLIPELGYHSRAEIVNDAIRRFIEARSKFDEKEPPRNQVQAPLIRSSQ
jgi:metal-responsive CopG/Arc/MetJ family transcriptional regulator